jgi:murein DD-endopeptidase MepM/ murein hydrolase activator NlpD
MQRWRIAVFRITRVLALLVGATPTWALPMASPPPPTVNAPSNFELGDPPLDELSPAQEAAMWAEIQHNVLWLRRAGWLAEPNPSITVTYNFPLQMAPGLPDYAGFRVSAFSDHNAATGQVLDYNGGARTYDGHRGTDYALYPFSWNKVDAGEAQVIAAAAGAIVYKGDTDPTDHNCNVSSGDPWNYIALAHADGRMTIYGHMRYHSLTSKGIGQPVAQGEYLGTAASSGNSSGPHLHFEARVDSAPSGAWIDPYAGPNSQPESLWTNQRPYYDSAINRLATHAGPPSTPDPCLPTITKFQDSFTAPVNVYFYAYYRDFQGALPTQFTVYQPNGAVFQSWIYTSATTFSSAWSAGQVLAFAPADPAGTWRYEAVYNGQTYQTFFNLNDPTTIALTSPNGGEQWARALAHTVTWNDNLGGAVNIALYHNNFLTATLATNWPSDGAYLWWPAPTQTITSGYTIRVTSVISPVLYDESDAPFALTTAAISRLFVPFVWR